MHYSTISRAPLLGLAQSISAYIVIVSALSSLWAEESAVGVAPSRTQVIELAEGWNSVYLEVEPVETDPDELFFDTPIEIAAAYLRPVTSQQFVEGPTQVLSDPKGWNVWYSPSREDALLTNLYDIQAHRSYLLFSKEAFTLNLSGIPYYGTAEWHPTAYSLVGFPIDAAQAPTVENFFSGVDAHEDLKIYRMVSGVWQLITNPSATLMESGVAYWTYAAGDSIFEGPLQVDFRSESLGGLVYTSGSGAQRLVFTNVSLYPQSLDFTVEPGEQGSIPLAYEVLDYNGEVDSVTQRLDPLGDSLSVPALEAGQSMVLNLQVIQSQVTAPLSAATLIIFSDAGLRIEVPIVNVRSDLE